MELISKVVADKKKNQFNFFFAFCQRIARIKQRSAADPGFGESHGTNKKIPCLMFYLIFTQLKIWLLREQIEIYT